MTTQDLVSKYRLAEDVDAVLVRLADIAGTGPGWLWPRRIPVGKVSLLVGDPGLGKSLLALDMAARVTRGLAWPDAAESGEAPRGRVVLMSGEDDAGGTIRPRLEALGGDPNMLAVLQAVRRPGSLLESRMLSVARDLSPIAESIYERRDTRLVIIDPLSAFLGGRASGSDAAVRVALLPLQALAECCGVAVLAISHLNKRAGGSVLYRAQGSLAYVATARAVWGTVPDPDCAGRRLFLPLKCNLAATPAGLAYRVVPSAASPEVPVVAWEAEPVSADAAEAMARSVAPTLRQEAAQWLKELLAGGAMACRQVQREAREVGWTPTAMRAAREALGVVVFRNPEGRQTAWMMRLPVEAAHAAQQVPAEAPPAAQQVPAEASPAAETTPVAAG